MIKPLFPFLLFSCITCLPFASDAQVKNKLEYFAASDVQLLPGIFKSAEQTDLKYILALDADKLLAPYLREAGLPAKTESYSNWENSGLDGHIAGHYVSALAMMYANTSNMQVHDRLLYVIDELEKCQQKNGNGYVGGVPGSNQLWQSVMKGDVQALQKKWVPFYNIHKMQAGLRDAYLYAGNEKAKAMLIKFSDWFVQLASSLSDKQMQEVLRIEHGGVNEVLADVYALTGDRKYLDAAYKFSHKAILDPLKAKQDKLNHLHANTQIPKVIGFKRIADVNNDTAYNAAATFFWNTVVNNRTVAIGGNSVREHFNPATNFTSMIQSEEGPETCNTYNMLKLTKQVYQSEALVKYVDYYERALYNHILSTQHPEKGGFVYFTPMRPGHYRVYSQPHTSMWCCVGSGIENHAKYNEMIYAHSGIDLYVNLFIPSKLQWKEQGVTITQETKFPEEERTSFTISTKHSKAFRLHIRYPSWVTAGAMKISINGKAVATKASPSSYLIVDRLWKAGDKVVVQLPMRTAVEPMPAGFNYVAVFHGPVVLAAKIGNDAMPGLYADDSRMGHVAKGPKYPLHEMPMFVTEQQDIAAAIKPVPGKPLTFKAPNIIHPAKYDKLELVPFYKIHDARYVIYWQKETPASLQAIQEKLAADEIAAAQLAAITIDQVKPGEQQPESDHFMQSEKSTTGVFSDRHFREARGGWFSYVLKDQQLQAKKLRITYWGMDRNRKFNILVNDTLIAQVELKGENGEDFYTVDYPLPAEVVAGGKGSLVVKFAAVDNSLAGAVYDIKLLK
ncbi:glycoside hydrolase family 127 protein [Aridibaculum aurantiacum]|uniref:glycoside hydrolase family 127 protein n=1 Tax=Aridibaculum aurantiacum TaxID=2810307 RepID=UPI001A95CCEB|nr:glycoside hydrolase family 127 protein [Aridibaculum aurantiacum]